MKKNKKKKIRHDEDVPLTRRQKVELAADIYERMVQGDTDGEIIDDLGITAQHFSAAKQFLLTTKGEEEERLQPKERFAHYVIQQERNMLDLNDLITNLNSKTQYSVIAGAIRMRADILDKIISTGQTLGVINKAAEKRLLFGNLNVTEMKDKELRRGVVDAIGGLSKLINKYGQDSNVRALPTGELHHGEAVNVIENDNAALGKPTLKEASSDKKNRAATNKRAAGRRRVRK